MRHVRTLGTHQVRREFDRFGRLKTLPYLNESPKNTPDVKFTYDVVGNQVRMSEYTGANFTNRVRETQFTYDDGDGTVDETVSYRYDAGGRVRLAIGPSHEFTCLEICTPTYPTINAKPLRVLKSDALDSELSPKRATDELKIDP